MKRIAAFEKVSFAQYEKDFADAFPGHETAEIRAIYDDITKPKRATAGSAGYDFSAPVAFVLKPGETIKIPTGIRARMEEDWVLCLFPRSGQGFKYRLQLNNTVGIIDSDYYNSDNEGHIMAKLTNDSNEGKVLEIHPGEGFLQGIFMPYGITEDDEADGVRNGGFGSTDQMLRNGECMKKRILLLTTGGTIASQDGGSGLAPVLSSDDFLNYIKEFEDVCELVPYEVCSIDSTNMEASWWLKLAGLIQKNYTLYDAFLICHGTDTMAYTAAALSYLIQNSVKPIVLTGAQKSILQEITDARKNLHDSIRCALDDRSRDVMLVFDGKIIAGTRAKKTATFSYNAFSSINFPVLGQIHDNTVVYYIQKDICGPVRFFNRMDRKVFLLKLTPGMSTEIIPHILSVYDCIIIEGFGVGGLPDRLRQALLEEMKHYKAHEKILIMATQVTYEGSSMDTYVVGRAAREQLPFLETYDMTLEAVLAKIMWILGLHMEDRKEIECLFYKKINYDLFRNE